MVVKIFQIINCILKFILNLMFFVQIVLMILIFITASYWFCELLNVDIMQFAQPVADACANIIRNIHSTDVQIGGIYTDGSFLVFDLCAALIVFFIAKFKYYLNLFIATNNVAINLVKDNVEKNFNAELQNEVEEKLRKTDSGAVLILFQMKNLFPEFTAKEDLEQAEKAKVNEAYNSLYSVLKNMTECKFAKVNGKMLITINNFDKTDNLLNYILLATEKLKQNYKEKKWLLQCYTAIMAYESTKDVKTAVYPALEKLIGLRMKNEIICMSDFRLRYDINPQRAFTMHLRGSYDIDGIQEVWAIVKKD